MKARQSIFPQSNLYEHEKNRAEVVYLRQSINRVYREYTWGETMDKARRVATFLMAQGFKRGDRIALLSKNCAEWIIVDFGILLAGMVTVPLYSTQYAKDIQYIINHSEAKAIFIGKLDNFDSQKDGIPSGVLRIDFPYNHRPDSKYNLEDIFSKYEPMQGEPLPNLDDVFSIMYTSGTTGNPKGATLTYKIMNSFIKISLENFKKDFQGRDDEHLFSYLPLAHIAERMIVELFSVGTNYDVSFTESLETFSEDIRNTQPTIFFAVPRIWTLFQLNVLKQIPQKKLDFLLKIPLISWIIRRRIKKGLGLNRSHVNISGAAPIPRNLLDWYAKLGIHIHEAYGATENMGYATLNANENFRVGSVGKARAGVSIKIDENGEILIKSPGTMAGYYKEPELTSKILEKDGYLHTGDMGHIDEDGFLFITGRIKEQFKTAKGEFISPAPIENKFSKNGNIEQCCLIGLGLAQPILLAKLSDVAQKKEPNEIEQDLLSTLEAVDEGLNKQEKVSHILIVKDLWTAENNLMTPTLKMKRHAIAEKYGPVVNDLQHQKQKIAWEK